MSVNKDGLEAGAPVDFETMKRVERERRESKKLPAKKREQKPSTETQTEIE